MTSSKIGENVPDPNDIPQKPIAPNDIPQKPIAEDLDNTGAANLHPAPTAQNITGAKPDEARTDNDYIARVRQICEDQRSTLVRWISSKLQNPARGEELAHDAINRVIEHAKKFQGEDEIKHVRGYLRTTARNLIHDVRKKDERLKIISWDDEKHATGLNPSDNGDAAQNLIKLLETNKLIEVAFKKITAEEKRLLDMRFGDRKSFADIARNLNADPGQVRYRINKLLAKMRSELTRPS